MEKIGHVRITIPDAERAVDLLKASGYQFSNGSLKELQEELENFRNYSITAGNHLAVMKHAPHCE